MNKIATITLAIALAIFSLHAYAQPSTPSFATSDSLFLLNGQPFQIHAAELHYPRIPHQYWRHRIQLCKALGMNTICLYVFWNAHEPRMNQFNFSDNLDIRAFCKIAASEGLYIILRPGPYVCAEWEMGGLPWWLLKKKDIRLRHQDDFFLQRVKIFEHEVAKQLADMTIDKGGPIIMVQVENEYGSYDSDKPYINAIKRILRSSGFDNVTLFQCDWSSNFHLNGLDDLLWTLNFGTWANPRDEFAPLKQLRPNTPLMCSEYWSGWFDKWGAPHETRPANDMISGIEAMLKANISFSLYMTHGGTSFSHWAGANVPGYQPDVTSYDYDAPISECGLPTPKYHALRTLMARFSTHPLPDIPNPPMPTITILPITLTQYAPLHNGFSSTLTSSHPLTFEDANIGWGAMLYSSTLPATTDSATLYAHAHDYAQIFINDSLIGTINRAKGDTSLLIPPTPHPAHIDILVDAMGRINYGTNINDHKGLLAPILLNSDTLTNWTCHPIPDDYQTALHALHDPQNPTQAPGYHRATFNLSHIGDTNLDLQAFGKGHVFVNGHNLGRYWHIGPQQTLYLPGCWLRKGTNEIIIIDYIGPNTLPTTQGLTQPILNKLNP